MKELKNLKTSNNKNLLVSIALNKCEPESLSESLYNLSNQSEPVDLLILVSDKLSEEEVNEIKSIADSPYKRVIKQDAEGNTSFEVIKSEKELNYALEITTAENFSTCFNDSFNLAVGNEYKWFSVIEPSDVVEIDWTKNFNRYSKDLKEVSIFLPLIRQIKAGNMVGHLNEATWLEGRAEVAGQADLQILMSWNCLAPIGAIFNVESIKEYSEEINGRFLPFKQSLNIAASYEFFLRMIYEDLKTYTIPRYGYQMRMDAIHKELDAYSSKIPSNITAIPKEKGGMSQKEVLFWMEQAKSEYFMKEDREIEYIEETV
jgi:hypothetical protein